MHVTYTQVYIFIICMRKIFPAIIMPYSYTYVILFIARLNSLSYTYNYIAGH